MENDIIEYACYFKPELYFCPGFQNQSAYYSIEGREVGKFIYRFSFKLTFVRSNNIFSRQVPFKRYKKTGCLPVLSSEDEIIYCPVIVGSVNAKTLIPKKLATTESRK